MNFETHGGFDYAELRRLGISPASLIDFSVNVNPFGPSPRAIAAFRQADPTSYPDRHCLDLRAVLAQANGVSIDSVLPGNGTAELIWLAAHAFLKPDDRTLIIGPTFGEYRRAACAVGANVIELQAAPPLFNLDVEEIVTRIQREQPRLVFLCNPNNPTGWYLATPDVLRIAAACAPGYLVLDEAYRSFVADSPFASPHTDNTLVLRSMTKDFALAGLRLGYALGTPGMITAMRSVQPAWSVSGPAQAAGLASLCDIDYLRQTLKATRESAQTLRDDLAGLGASVLPSATHYLLIHVGDAARCREKLMAEGCLVRDCASFGLPQHVRVGARTAVENQRLVDVWARIARA